MYTAPTLSRRRTLLRRLSARVPVLVVVSCALAHFLLVSHIRIVESFHHSIEFFGMKKYICNDRSGPKAVLTKHTRRCQSHAIRNMASSSSDDDQSILMYDDFLPSPNPTLNAMDVVEACMSTLIDGYGGSGLEVCFEFSNDRCRAALGGSLERFRQYATNPVFGYLVNCHAWGTISVGPIINGTVTRGDMQTILMKANYYESMNDEEEEQEEDNNKSDNNKKIHSSRDFLWTLQKERRPPRQGCWLIHEVIYVKNAYQLTL